MSDKKIYPDPVINPTELDKSLRQFLRSKTKQLKTMSATDVLHLASEHWETEKVDGLKPIEGDGLVAYFELVNRGRGILFEFGVNRILRMLHDDNEKFWEWTPCFKLRLSIAYKVTPEIFQLKAPVAVFSCWDKMQTSSFVSEVESSSQFQSIAHYTPHSSGINLCEISGPPGNPNHATKGLTWAIT